MVLSGSNSRRIAGWEAICYFRGIAEALRGKGIRVAVPRLSATSSVAWAEELKTYIHQHFPKEKVHIIAHSMGGLDARYAISSLGLDQHTISLTTVGTPHQAPPPLTSASAISKATSNPGFNFYASPTKPSTTS